MQPAVFRPQGQNLFVSEAKSFINSREWNSKSYRAAYFSTWPALFRCQCVTEMYWDLSLTDRDKCWYVAEMQLLQWQEHYYNGKTPKIFSTAHMTTQQYIVLPTHTRRHNLWAYIYRIFSNLIRTSFCRFLQRKKGSSRF